VPPQKPSCHKNKPHLTTTMPYRPKDWLVQSTEPSAYSSDAGEKWDYPCCLFARAEALPRVSLFFARAEALPRVSYSSLAPRLCLACPILRSRRGSASRVLFFARAEALPRVSLFFARAEALPRVSYSSLAPRLCLACPIPWALPMPSHQPPIRKLHQKNIIRLLLPVKNIAEQAPVQRRV